MYNQLFMARQPILDANNQIYGYELYYRDNHGENTSDNPRFATSTVLVNLLNQIGLQKGIGDAKAFININSDMLLTDILQNLPTNVFVFELCEKIIITRREIEAIAELHQLGYEFSLDNVSLSKEYYQNFVSIFPYITYAKFDTMMTDIQRLESQINLYKQFKLIAQKVEFHELYETYLDLGFDYFQGYFFARPHLIQQGRIDPKHLGIIKLFNMLQLETPIDEFADVFQRHNELSMQLLQFANSTSLLKTKKTSSIREIIEAMGEKQLQQWLIMIIYSKSGKYLKNEKSSQSIHIQKRIDLMLNLLALIKPENNHALAEQVRFLAFMSLLEATFNVPLASILKNVHVSDDIEEALLTHTGQLGRIYALALSIESSDFAATQVLLKPYNLNIDDLVEVIEQHLYN